MLKRFIINDASSTIERLLCSSMRARVSNHYSSFIRSMSSKVKSMKKKEDTIIKNNNNTTTNKKSTVVLKVSKKADLNSVPVKVKKNIMIRHLTTIKGPGEFLYHLRYKGRKVSN